MSAKTPTEQVYCDLLAMPLPRTLLDFRRAIVMAALIGRQLESEFAARIPTDPIWHTAPPTEPGAWEVICAETDFKPSHVRVFYPDPTSRLRPLGVLWVECSDVGTNPVDIYHHALTETRWRKVATGEDERLVTKESIPVPPFQSAGSVQSKPLCN